MRTYLKLGALSLLIPSQALAAKAVCLTPAEPIGLSAAHIGTVGVPGSFLSLSFDTQGNTGSGVLQLDTSPTDNVKVTLIEDGTNLRNYDISIACQPTSLGLPCDSVTGLLMGQPVTKGKTTTQSDWQGSLKVSFDADDDVLVVKLVQLSTLTGTSTLCGALWYVMGGLACTSPTPDQCGTACTSLQTDASNCGACGNICTAGDSCQAGACVAPVCNTANAPNLCGNSCTNLQTDIMNCGTCGNACNATGCYPGYVQVCSSGVCNYNAGCTLLSQYVEP